MSGPTGSTTQPSAVPRWLRAFPVPDDAGGRGPDGTTMVEERTGPRSRARPARRLAVHLLGRPRIEVDGTDGYRFRSRKSWALLAFLLLAERPPARAQLTSLLFADAVDPLRALRWCLAEIRRGLGPDAAVDGDPVLLSLPSGTTVDVDVVERGHWTEAIELPGLGSELLDGLEPAHADAYESWLLSQRRRLAGSTESILHEGALGLLARGDLATARALAVRAALMSPLDENHQALLIRLYRLSGDDAAAERQFEAWSAVAADELGAVPGAAVVHAMRERHVGAPRVDAAGIQAMTEAATAAVSAGAFLAGITSFETAVRMADRGATTSLRVDARLVLAEALIHSLGGLDEEGVATLAVAERIAAAAGDAEAVSRARAESGYVDFLRGRYDRAERALEQVRGNPVTTPSTWAKATTYLGSVASDRADYPAAVTLLEEAVRASRMVGEPRREAFARSMLGRVGLLRGDLALAAEHLEVAAGLADREHWLSFIPWPQALLGQVLLTRGDDGAARCLEQSFARACQIGDPCWEGIAARGLALLQEAAGDAEGAIDGLLDARSRSTRLPDPYVWLDVYILDALCRLGLGVGHPRTRAWADEMLDRAARSGMRELTVRAMLHKAALGDPGEAQAAAILAADIENPELTRLVRNALPAASPLG